jgi:hypothetical protein
LVLVGLLGAVQDEREAGVKPGELACELDVEAVVSKSASLQDSEQ